MATIRKSTDKVICTFSEPIKDYPPSAHEPRPLVHQQLPFPYTHPVTTTEQPFCIAGISTVGITNLYLLDDSAIQPLTELCR